MIVVSGRFPIRPDQRDRAVEGALKMSEASEAEPGCQTYRFSTDLADPNVFHLFECWETDEAIDTHASSAHMAEFMKLAADVLAGAPQVTRYEVSASAPLF